MQKFFIVFGVILIILGLLWPWLTQIPFGRLPGDIVIERPGFRFYFPITTMVLVSLVLSVILWLIGKIDK